MIFSFFSARAVVLRSCGGDGYEVAWCERVRENGENADAEVAAVIILRIGWRVARAGGVKVL